MRPVHRGGRHDVDSSPCDVIACTCVVGLQWGDEAKGKIVDLLTAEHDYVVNLRAELEIMHLHDKVDAIRDRQLMELLKRQNEAIRLLKNQVEKLTAGG